VAIATADVEVPVEAIAAAAAEVDRDARFPVEAVAALRESGLLGLPVPAAFGGPGAGAARIAAAIEQVSGACSSAGMVYTMHVCATATLAAGTPAGDDGPRAEALRAAAAGRMLLTLAYSEAGTRSHFWAQASRAVADGDGVRIDADKSFVTSAGHADAIVAAVGAPGSDDPLCTDLYLLDASASGIEVLGAFDGLGMCGNASAPVALRGVHATAERRLCAPGEGFAQMLAATLPWFVIGCAACCCGLAGTALRLACDHAGAARFSHLDSSLADLPTIRHRLAVAQVRLLETRALLAETVRLVEVGAPEAQLAILALKASGAEMAIAVTDEAMRVCGGAAYARQLPLERLFRDARAAAVMAPTTDVLRDLVGRAITGLPLF
jgi:alkylation response protein AidB-like acyl-CoA dehydrogenase